VVKRPSEPANLLIVFYIATLGYFGPYSLHLVITAFYMVVFVTNEIVRTTQGLLE
jgi:hypothetical protein